MKKLWARIKRTSPLTLWVTFLVLKVIDNATTYYFLKYTTYIKEINPIMVYTFKEFGVDMGLAVNFALVVPLSYMLYRIGKAAKHTTPLWILDILGVIVVTNNLGWIVADYIVR